MCIEYQFNILGELIPYHVSAPQDGDESMINVHYYYYY